MLSAARNLGLELHVLNASSESDLDGVFADVTKMRVGGLVIGGSPFFTSRTKQLGALALRIKLDRIYRLHDGSFAIIDYKTGGDTGRSGWLGDRPRQRA